jgi:proteasome lid subunit RPN8/RPN11
MLTMSEAHLDEMASHARACNPHEACGLLVGRSDDAGHGRVVRFVPMTNAAASPVIYELDPKEHLRVEMAAEDDGLEVIGVMHSHTHSEPYPSVTDVAKAPDPGWHFVIVSLKRADVETRSYRIRRGAPDGWEIREEVIELA